MARIRFDGVSSVRVKSCGCTRSGGHTRSGGVLMTASVVVAVDVLVSEGVLVVVHILVTMDEGVLGAVGTLVAGRSRLRVAVSCVV